MKTKIIFSIPLIFLFAITANAKLPVIKAIGGEGQNVDWPAIKHQDDSIGDSPGYFYNDCSQGDHPLSASSTLAAQGQKNYSVENLADDSPMTAWVEGKPGYGIGEWFELEGWNANTICNGYQSTPTNWKNNSRVKRFKVYCDKIAICFLDLTDEMGRQRFELPGNYSDKNHIFRFEIVDVYQGLKFDDVAISEVENIACCFAPSTLIQLSSANAEQVGKINSGSTVLCLNLGNDSVFSSEIVKTTTQQHLSLLEISTPTKKIQITPNHPLYIKDYGFISLSSLMNKMKLTDIKQLEGKIEVLTWNNETGKTEFETITTITKLTGDFQTCTILKIKSGDTYIANGFISKVY
jgi:hypothetical protein